MADALVSIAKEKISNAAREQLDLFAGAADQLESLKSTFESIQALVVDAESRHVAEEGVHLWLSRLRAVSYDIDDVLDEWAIISSGGNDDDDSSSSRSWIASKVCECFVYLYDALDYVVSRQKVAWSIQEIRKKLDQIADEKNKYGFVSSGVGAGGDHVIRSERLTTSLLDESEMVIGRENDKEVMISSLVGGSEVHVVAIVGIGGLGKTTLARQIYHDGRVRDHFDMFLWVCVSDVFDVVRITVAILNEVGGPSTTPSLSELNSLQNQLAESLRGKQFLLVLDDVWNDDEDDWKMLRLPLIKGAPRSRILVTTRSEKVATTMNATFIHELKGLSDDDSWKLFRSRAFAGRKGKEYAELETVGREIVTKCKGIPLSVKVIGSAMRSKTTFEDWKNVLDSGIWSLSQVTDKILPTLVLTYCYLPIHLKQCFVYCSIFPKDSELEKGFLVRLWVAQGFIPSEGNREIEDIGAEYFDELVARSLFQEVEENSDGEIECKMHDLVHDLAEFIVKDEIYTFISSSRDGENSSKCSTASINCNVRHSFLNFIETLDDIPVSFGRAEKLRSLFLLSDEAKNAIFDLFCQARFLRALHFECSTALPESIFNLKHLRYLNIKSPPMVELPNSIGKMKQLMYLDLSNTNIVALPESVIHLCNLHTLNLNGCNLLEKLPKGTGKLVRLRHLEIKDTSSLECLPRGLCEITSLRTLRRFMVGGEGGCEIDELQPLNSLQGSLEIKHLHRVSSREEAERAQLWNKPHIRSLALRMLASDGDADRERMEGVFEGLKPQTNLEELELDCYPCSKLPSWMELMPCLRKLFLYHCPKLEWLPHHLANASLKALKITDCDGIKGIENSSSFPLLEKLILTNSSEFFSSGLMPDLPNLKILEISKFRNERLPDGGWERLVALETLVLEDCTVLKSLPDGLAQAGGAWTGKLERLPGEEKGLGQLRKLNHLQIIACYALGSLPHGLQHLSLLRVLEINNGIEQASNCKFATNEADARRGPTLVHGSGARRALGGCQQRRPKSDADSGGALGFDPERSRSGGNLGSKPRKHAQVGGPPVVDLGMLLATVSDGTRGTVWCVNFDALN
ncbi:hypothetical protein ACLOJK_008042 [Asimina triloba]